MAFNAIKSTFKIRPESFIFLMERWAEWNCSQSLGANLGYPRSSEFANTKVDNGGSQGARVLVSDHHDMEQIEMWVCSIAEKNPEIAEALRAKWEAKPIYHGKCQSQKAAIAGMKVRAFRDRFSTGNLMMLMAMEVARFRPDLGYEDFHDQRQLNTA
tara:strand:+ start:6749 stop:7219 length:471 start_codon:yes stop_codon:yes gene_type:complete